MKRAVIIAASIVTFFGALYSFYYFAIRPPYSQANPLLAFGLFVGLLVLAFVLFVWSMSDNIYKIKSGTVIQHSFTPAHMAPGCYVPGTPAIGTSPGTPSVYVPSHWVDDDWALQLRDRKDRTGWIHFSQDVFTDYPVGSRYPRSTSK